MVLRRLVLDEVAFFQVCGVILEASSPMHEHVCSTSIRRDEAVASVCKELTDCALAFILAFALALAIMVCATAASRVAVLSLGIIMPSFAFVATVPYPRRAHPLHGPVGDPATISRRLSSALL